ncbi:MAG: hypothetical protein SPL39_11605 [Selenomonadaceae bacterium]|nr:hypothetical protein [Selenomonadaceae bacterium]
MRPRAAALLIVLLLLPLWMPQAVAAEQPRLMVAGFTSRVEKTDITMSDIDIPLASIVAGARDVLQTELAGSPAYTLVDFSSEVTRMRLDEAAVMQSLGTGTVDPALMASADYIVYGYLTTLSNVKAQSGALVFTGKDRTVYAELSLRVIDAKTGTVVFVTKADSRRKSELRYHAIAVRNDVGVEDAVRQAVEDAAVNLAAAVRAAV